MATVKRKGMKPLKKSTTPTKKEGQQVKTLKKDLSAKAAHTQKPSLSSYLNKVSVSSQMYIHNRYLAERMKYDISSPINNVATLNHSRDYICCFTGKMKTFRKGQLLIAHEDGTVRSRDGRIGKWT